MHSFYLALTALAFLAMFASAQTDQPLPFGVGMSLSLGYATISIYDSNQTYTDIARIEGGVEYKQFMKTHLPSNDQRYSTATDTLSQTFLPAWSPFSKRPPILRMLTALKQAAEAYLEDTVKDVTIVFPYDYDNNFSKYLKATAQLTGLDAKLRQHTPSASAAALAQGNYDTDCTVPPNLVLAIDYSKKGIAAQLAVNECTAYDSLSWLYSSDLSSGNSTTQKSLVAGLEKLIASADKTKLKEYGIQNTQVSALSLSGESADDSTLRDALGSMKSVDGVDATLLDLLPAEQTTPPTWAAARWAAYYRRELGHAKTSHADEI